MVCVIQSAYSWVAMVGFHLGNLFTWHLMWRRRSTAKVDFIKWKKIIFEEVILYSFQNCFPVLENTALFVSLTKFMPLSTCKLTCIYIVFNSHTMYFCPNQTWNFVTNIFSYQLFPKITWHGIKKGLLMKCEILGLLFGWCTIENWPYVQTFTTKIVCNLTVKQGSCTAVYHDFVSFMGINVCETFAISMDGYQ